jgi:AcrR family transcriptional regulator
MTGPGAAGVVAHGASTDAWVTVVRRAHRYAAWVPSSPEQPAVLARGRRAERTATSRARILDAAVTCLVESGYQGATTLNIQARAGVSRGRLLHHFPSRDQLLVAASRHLTAQRLVQSDERLADIPDSLSPGERLDRGMELMWQTFSEPIFWASVELWTAARTNPDLRAVLMPQEQEVGVVIRSGLDRFYGPELIAHPSYEAVRDLVLTSMRGVAMSYALTDRDPRTDPHLAIWKRAARTLLD